MVIQVYRVVEATTSVNCGSQVGGSMVDVPRREDRFLDKVSELISRRDDTLRWLDLCIECDPRRAAVYWFLIDQLEGTDA